MEKIKVQHILGVLILFWIISSIGLEKIVTSMKTADLRYFLIGGLFYLIAELLAGVNLQILFKGSIFRNLILHMRGMVYSVPTPGRIGYLWIVYELSKRQKISIPESTALIGILQAFSLIIKVSLAACAILYFSSLYQIGDKIGYFFITLLFPSSIVLSLFFFFTIIKRIRILEKIGIPKSIISKVVKINEKITGIKIADAIKIVSIGVLAWIFLGIQWFFIAKALSIDVSLATVLMLHPLLTAILFTPISPSGIGVAEGGAVLMFSILGISASQAIAFLLLVRINSFIFDFLVGFSNKI